MFFTQRRCFVKFTLFLLAVCAHGQDGEKKEPKKIDEWETEEPEYEVPQWNGPEGVQTLEFGGGNLNDGDKWSDHMPMELKCDGCRAIAYAIKQKLKRYQKRFRTRHILSEVDVVDLMDQVCHNTDKDFDGYGLKEILGIRRLSGPGLETKDVPGVSHGGGKWPYRLQQMCQEYVEEIGEYRIYKQFLKHKSMENVLCRNKKSELGWICPRKRKKKKKEDPEEGEGEGSETSQPAPEGSDQTQNSDQPTTDSEQPSETSSESMSEERKQAEQGSKDENKPSEENTKQNEHTTPPKPQEDSGKLKDEEDKKTSEDKKPEDTKSEEDADNKDGTKTDKGSTKPDENTKKPEEDDTKDKGDPGFHSQSYQTPYDPRVPPENEKKADQDSKKPNGDSNPPKEDTTDAKKTSEQSKEDKKPAKEEL